MGRYLYDGKEFSSTKSLSKYCGVKETTIRARFRRGMSVDEACLLTDHRCRYIEEKPLVSIIREQGQDPDLVNNRLKYGYTLSEALNTPKKITRQGRPIIVHGILYQSISAALRALELEDKESIIRGRLNRGYKPNDAFSFLNK